MVWMIGHVLTIIPEGNSLLIDEKEEIKIYNKIFKKYGKEDIIIDLKTLGFNNIKFRYEKGIGNEEILTAYNIYATYNKFDKNHEYNPVKDYIDYVLERKGDEDLKIYRGSDGFFNNIPDKEWYIKI